MEWKFKYYDILTGIDWLSLETNCDWFRDMADIPQDKIWHAEGDVQIHTKMVCEALAELPEFKKLSDRDKHILMTSALMHDIEKRSTTEEKEKDGRVCVVAPKHADRGEKTARIILYKDFDCPYQIRELICKLVKWHGKPLHNCSEKTIINLATQVPIIWLSMLSKADILGRICDDADTQLYAIEFFSTFAEDLQCFNSPREFKDMLTEYTYLSKDVYLDYEPFDDTKFKVTMLSALPGSGKDTYLRNHLPGANVISLDDIRIEMGVKRRDTKGNGQVIQEAKERAKKYMRKHVDFVWNATNITKQLRSQIIDLFLSYGARVEIIYIEVPYKQTILQNKSREDMIPQTAIDKMIEKLEPPVREEAHSITYYVNQ